MGSAVMIFIVIVIASFLTYEAIPSKYTKIEESLVGFINGILVRFEHGKSLLHTIVYSGTGTGKTYFVRQYL